jgi:hypothetical protein
MLACVRDDFRNTTKQVSVIERRFTDLYTVFTELTCITDKPGRVSECANWNRAIIRSHAAECVARNESCFCAQIRRAKGSYNAGRTGTDNNYFSHLVQASGLSPILDGK